jgi:hypothetical protein
MLPYFCLSCTVDGFLLDECTSEQRASYATKLSKWAQMTWLELRTAPKHGLGYEKIDDVRVPRPSHIPEDATFIAFRFHDRLPVVGYRTDRIFHAVWFDSDPKGRVYRH